MGLIFPDAGQWLLSQKGDAWNDNVYDTAYSLIALADMDIQDPAGYQWLLDNYGPEWNITEPLHL